jgi:hypothetical protein
VIKAEYPIRHHDAPNTLTLAVSQAVLCPTRNSRLTRPSYIVTA